MKALKKKLLNVMQSRKYDFLLYMFQQAYMNMH